MTNLRTAFCLLVLTAGALTSFAADRVKPTDDTLIVPGATRQAEARGESSSGYGAISVLGVLVLAGAGAWMLVRGRKLNLKGADGRSLNVTETKSLGNRQYLVVATYEDKKFLLGVCPGRIDLLSTLENGNASKKTP